MLKSLKAATSERHAALERLLPLLDAKLSPAEYRHFVQRLFGFYEPFEARMLAAPGWNATGLDYTSRLKTPKLQQDLLALGDTTSSLAALPRCEQLPPLTSPAQLWGCLYVIEGATLGGQIIMRKLHANLGLDAASGAAFFYGYGPQTGAHWKAFCAAASEQGEGAPEDLASTLVSANMTFDLLGAWLFPEVLALASEHHS